MTLKKYVRWLLPFAFLFIFLATTASGCTDQAETDATSRNHDAINANLPIPDLTYSQRRWVLLQYYAQVLNKPISPVVAVAAMATFWALLRRSACQ